SGSTHLLLRLIMPSDTKLHVVTLGELRAGRSSGWIDPDGLGQMTECKRKAFLTNPLQHGESEPVQIVATVDDHVAGRIDLLAGEFVVRQRPVPVLWGTYLHVGTAWRGRGIALAIVRHMHDVSPTVAICGISEISSGIYDKLSWVRFKIPRMVCLLR